jgi:hypothetical protein
MAGAFCRWISCRKLSSQKGKKIYIVVSAMGNSFPFFLFSPFYPPLRDKKTNIPSTLGQGPEKICGEVPTFLFQIKAL